ncbi:MAG: DUF1643 domain-containing protein [Dehalococcoidia bacterium]|nr:DUF1643 domain-containing protein [Dehalococcoidia bacterium]
MTVSERRNTARFSANGIYRYLLTRSLGGSATCLFIMLNPSSADAENDDPTIRRCIGFANREGYGRLEVVNLYAYRTAEPLLLFAQNDPVGPDNDREISEALTRSDLVIAAWGNQAEADPDRVAAVNALIERSGKPTNHFGLTKLGHPKHPLFLRADAGLLSAQFL